MSRMDSRFRGNDERLGAMNRAPTSKPTLVSSLALPRGTLQGREETAPLLRGGAIGRRLTLHLASRSDRLIPSTDRQRHGTR